MKSRMHALEATLDGQTELLGVFDTPEDAKAFAQGEENEHADEDLSPEEDWEVSDAELEWVSGQDYTGDPCEVTGFDASYSGAVYKVSLVRVNPIPWRKV